MDEAMLKEFLWGAKDDCSHIERLLLSLRKIRPRVSMSSIGLCTH